jgi:hypothetical protein
MPRTTSGDCETSPAGRFRTRTLRVKLTQGQAIERAAVNPGKVLGIVPGSGEQRRPPLKEIYLRPSGGAMKTPGFGEE